MFNRFASKAIVPVALSLTGFVIVCSLLLYSSIKEGFMRDAVRQETSLADTVVSSTRYTMMTDDRESLYHIIDSIGAQKGIEHLRIFNKEGVIMFSSNPEELNQVVDKTTAGCIECHSGSEPTVRLGSMELARRFVNADNNSVLAITSPIYNDAHCSAGECHFHPPPTKSARNPRYWTLDSSPGQQPARPALENDNFLHHGSHLIRGRGQRPSSNETS